MKQYRGHLPRRLVLALTAVVIPLVAAIALQVYEAINRPRALALDRAWIAHTFQVHRCGGTPQIDGAERRASATGLSAHRGGSIPRCLPGHRRIAAVCCSGG
jgi:hypothetical protein